MRRFIGNREEFLIHMYESIANLHLKFVEFSHLINPETKIRIESLLSDLECITIRFEEQGIFNEALSNSFYDVEKLLFDYCSVYCINVN